MLYTLYSTRLECLLVDQTDLSLLSRWFIGLSMGGPILDHSTFTKNQDWLLEADITQRFFRELVR